MKEIVTTEKPLKYFVIQSHLKLNSSGQLAELLSQIKPNSSSHYSWGDGLPNHHGGFKIL